MNGHEESMWRMSVFGLIQRKTGDAPVSRLTRGSAEIHHLLYHQLNSLPEVQLPPVQNIDGTFNLMRGWDLPQE